MRSGGRCGSAAFQAARLAARLGEHQPPERHDQAGLLGDRDEVGRRDEARAPGGASARAPRTRRMRAVGERARSAGSRARARRARARGAGRVSSAQPLAAPARASSGRTPRSGRGRRSLARYIAASASRSELRGVARAVGGRDRHADRGRREHLVRRRARRRVRSVASARSAIAQRLVGRAEVLAHEHELVAAERRDRVARRARRRRAGARPRTSSSSPTSWPRLSLTSLKRSRSMNSTATAAPRARRAGSACSSRSSSSVRFGSPVSASCSAWCGIGSSARPRSTATADDVRGGREEGQVALRAPRLARVRADRAPRPAAPPIGAAAPLTMPRSRRTLSAVATVPAARSSSATGVPRSSASRTSEVSPSGIATPSCLAGTPTAARKPSCRPRAGPGRRRRGRARARWSPRPRRAARAARARPRAPADRARRPPPAGRRGPRPPRPRAAAP